MGHALNVMHSTDHHEDSVQHGPLRDWWLWLSAVTLILLVGSATQSWRLIDFDHDAPGLLITATLLHVAAGAVFLAMLLRGRRYQQAGVAFLISMIILGVILRLASAPTAPAWEDDFYRYLWDGAVASQGVNPYEYPPEVGGSEGGGNLHALAGESGIVHDRINHAHLRTIYPPLAQASFAAVYHIAPWSFNAWRGVILLHDVATMFLLVLLLRGLGLSSMYAAVYWINPLLVKEFYQSAHMDALLLPWIVGALLMLVRYRAVMASALLAAATAVKLWPAILLPILLRREASRPHVLSLGSGVFVILAGLLLAPMLIHEPAAGSGLARYAEAWQNNAGFYAAHHAVWTHALPLIGIDAWHSQTVTRWATAILLITLLVLLTWPRITSERDAVHRCLLAAAAIFLISPTQFPWYFVWLVPLLAVWPIRALVLYTALLPLYHLNEIAPWVVWVQHVPVWALLMHDGTRSLFQSRPDRAMNLFLISDNPQNVKNIRRA